MAELLITSAQAKFILHDPAKTPFASSASATEVLSEIKDNADERYHRFLADRGQLIPQEAKGSGLVLLSIGRGWHEVVNEGRLQVYEEAAKRWVLCMHSHLEDCGHRSDFLASSLFACGTSLGLLWVNEHAIRVSMLTCDVVQSCFVPGRIDGEMPHRRKFQRTMHLQNSILLPFVVVDTAIELT